MPIADFRYIPGTIKNPQNTKSSQAAFEETSLVNFPDGKLTPLPNFFSTTFLTVAGDLEGICRAQWAARKRGGDSDSGAYYYFGTHSHFYSLFRGDLYNITPLEGQKSELLGSDPLSFASTDATMTVTWTAHGLSVGDYVVLSGATDAASVVAATYINIGHVVDTVPTADTFTVELGTTAGSTATGGGDAVIASSIALDDTLGTDPLSVTDTETAVVVTYTDHGFTVGDRFMLQGATATGGVTAATLNAEHIVTVVTDANTFEFEATAATSTTTGGGSVVRIYRQIAAGIDVQQLNSGWGYGIFGLGIFGIGGFSDTEQAYPRIASFDNFGNDIVFCPGDYNEGDGQKIYFWNQDTDIAPTVLTNAPTNCNWTFVLNNAVVALCDSQVKVSEIGNATVWSGLTTYSVTVQRTSRLLSGFPVGEKQAVIFAPDPYLLRFVGGEWDFVELGIEFAIAAPNAACKYKDGLLWYGEDGNFYFFNGSNVQTIKNEQNGEYIWENINRNAIWTTFMMADQKHSQAYLYFPTGSSDNPNEYVIFNSGAGDIPSSFTLGEQDRTSCQKPAIIDTQFYMMNQSDAYSHFQSGTSEFAWSAKSAYFYINGVNRFKLTSIMPDMYRSGSVNIQIYSKETPQGTEVSNGTYTLTTADGYKTVRGAGKLMALEFSGSSDVTLQGAKLDFRAMGGGLR